MKQISGVKVIAVILVIAIFAYLAFFGVPSLQIPSAYNTRLGIDIKGGVYTTLYPDLPNGQKPSADELKAAQAVIEKRLDYKGIYDRTVTTENQNGRIIVEIPWKSDEKDFNPQKTVDEMGKTALLTFQEVDESKVDQKGNYLPTGKIVIEGKNVKNATVEPDSKNGGMVVALKLDEDGAKKFEEGTGRLIGKRIAIFMDDQLISAPTVQNKITGGEAIITGQRDAKEAGSLADTIRAGSLPFKLTAKEVNSISPILGEGALKVAINAGIVAFILVCLFMLILYRLPGLIADFALIGLVSMQLFVIAILQISLTLPGIAGIILSVGMGVDANVIIFERIKEEIRSGKTLRAAIDAGFKRAFAAIFDSNITTMITAGVLYALGSGSIKGFALTLFLGVLISFFTAVTVTRILLKTVSEFKPAKNIRLYGVREVLR